MPKTKTKTETNQPRAIEIAAEAKLEWSDLEAAEGEEKTPRFSMDAYTGAELRIAGFADPIVVDLAGVTARSSVIPIFRGHDPDRIVGHGTSTISGGGIKVEGEISADNEHSRDVIASSKRGFPWQASIGAMAQELESVRGDESVNVNGRDVDGPVLIARKTTLNEVSFVPLGADRRTSATVAATSADQSKRNLDMKFKEWLAANEFDEDALTEKQVAKLQAQYESEQAPEPEPEPSVHGKGFRATLAAEKKEKARVDEIDAYAAQKIREYPESIDDIEKLTIAAQQDKSTDIKDFKLAILEMTHATKVQPWRRHGSDRGGVSNKVIEAAVCKTLRLGTVEKHYDDQTLEAADKHFPSGVGLKQLLFKAAAANGQHYDGVGNLQSLLEAAFAKSSIQAQGWSTFSLPGILSNVMNKVLLDYFMAATDSADPRVEQVWRNIAEVRPVNDFKTSTSYGLTGDAQYKLLPPNGEIKHGTLGETAYPNKADTHALMLAADRRDIINDDLGALQRIPQKLGRGGALAIFNAFWAEFLNNSSFFTAGNNNIVSVPAAFDATGNELTEMEKVFSAQTDPDGKPLGVAPSILLVPPSLLNNALRLMNSSLTVGGSSNVADANVLGGRYRVYSSMYMENSTYTGNSATATYLLANPMDVAAIEMVFLNGRETPVIERADADFNVLGIQVRAYHDFGVASKEPRGGVRSAGA